MTSNVSRESAMLIVSSRSSRKGATGKISNRMVANNATTNHKSPYFNNLRIRLLKVSIVSFGRVCC